MKKNGKKMLSMLLCTAMILGVCPVTETPKKVQAADVITATNNNVEYKDQAEAIITANAEWEYVKVRSGATVEKLVGDITETGAEISVTNQANAKKTSGALTSTDRLVVKKGGSQTIYDVIVMGDTSATGITAKKTDDYEFGMLGSNIGTIEDDKITLIDGKVRQLKHNDVSSKEDARKVNLSDYSGDVGRREALRNANEIVTQLESVNDTKQSYKIQSASGEEKTNSKPVSGDKLVVTAEDGKTKKTYDIVVQKAAVSGKLELNRTQMTAGAAGTLVLDYYAGQRSPEATVEIDLPMAVKAENISVNLIGRGNVPFANFGDSTGKLDENGYFENEAMHEVIGRYGSLWKYETLGTASLINGGKTMRFTMLDLRANNGVDLRITIENVRFDKKGDYCFAARYTTAGSKADKALSGLSSMGGSSEQAVLTVDNEIRDLMRLPYDPALADPNHTYKDGGVTGLSYLDYSEMGELYTAAYLQWTPMAGADNVDLYQAMGTVENGGNVKPGDWKKVGTIANNGHYTVKNLTANRYYQFKLVAQGGAAAGESNVVEHYSGKLDAAVFGAAVGGNGADNKNAVNKAIDWLSSIGGGTINFKGNGNNDNPSNYPMGTLHLKDNVYLYVEKGARLQASKNNMDKPESAWFHYRDFNNDENGAFYNTENFLSKQDDGHSNFRNCMFFAMRAENIKIIGNGRLDGDKVIQKGDGTVNNNGGIDKMIAFKLCNNVEIGGINTRDDLKYDTDNASAFSKPNARPYYEKAGDDLSNMLYIDRNGHFALLSTATDNINLHDTFVSRYAQDDYSRDAFDFMANRNVYVTNIFSMQSSDDIMKLGSECSMGFTRPAWNYKIRNIIGDSYCNNFQLGSETADDIQDVYVDNLVVLGSNKAGFSISANDGALVKNVNLNTGATGPVFKESGYFQKSNTSVFISISHRGRVIGAEDYKTSAGKRAIRNVPIGHVDQVTLKDVKIVDAFSGSLYGAGNGPSKYDPNKRKNETNDDEYTPVIVGYKMPEGVTSPNMPDGRNIGYITNVTLENIDLTVKGYNQNGNYKFSDTERTCAELDVGQFNSRNMGVRPSYAFYVRHAQNVTFKNCRFDFEGTNGGTDDRYPVVFDDVKTATMDNVTMAKGNGVDGLIQMRDADNINLYNCSYFEKSGNGSAVSVKNAAGLEGGTAKDDWGVYPNGNMVDEIALEVLASSPNASLIKAIDGSKIQVQEETTVGDLLSALKSANGHVLNITVVDKNGTTKENTAKLQQDDKVVAVSEDGKRREYTIEIVAWNGYVRYMEGEQMNSSVRTEPTGIQLASSRDNGSERYIEYTDEQQGDSILIDFDIPVNGYYSIDTVIKQGVRATVQGMVDGTNVGDQIDLGASAGLQDISTELNCGKTGKFFLKQVTDSVYLKKGTHTFAFKVTKESADGGVVLHSLRFHKVADAASSIEVDQTKQIDYEVKLNGNVTLKQNVKNPENEEVFYQWYKDGSEEKNILSNRTGQTLELNNIKPEDIGDYYCVVSDVNGELNRNALTKHHVYLEASPDEKPICAITPVAGEKWVQEGEKLTLKASVLNPEEGASYKYVWTEVNPFTKQEQPLTGVSESDSNKAEVVVTVPKQNWTENAAGAAVQEYRVSVSKVTNAQEGAGDAAAAVTNVNVLSGEVVYDTNLPETSHPLDKKYDIQGYQKEGAAKLQITFDENRDVDVLVIDENGTAVKVLQNGENTITISGGKAIFYVASSGEYGYKINSILDPEEAPPVTPPTEEPPTEEPPTEEPPTEEPPTEIPPIDELPTENQTETETGNQTLPPKDDTPKETVPPVHTIVTIKGINYEVTKSDAKNGEVMVKSISKSKKKTITKLTIPDTVKIDGYKFRVRKIAKNAFKDCKKLKKVTIGKNVTKIEANAFANNKKLKTILVKGTAIKSIGKNALKRTNTKLTVKVPRKKLKSHKKLWRGKGNKGVKVVVK